MYRKLVSELHPDREPDASERKRKTELMQRVNVAYEAGDLLVLLELQLSIEQINPDALANTAEARLAHFNRVLKNQPERLQDELFDITAPLIMGMGHAPHMLTPEAVLKNYRIQRDHESDSRSQRRRAIGRNCLPLVVPVW